MLPVPACMWFRNLLQHRRTAMRQSHFWFEISFTLDIFKATAMTNLIFWVINFSDLHYHPLVERQDAFCSSCRASCEIEMSDFLGSLAGMRTQRSISWMHLGKLSCVSFSQPLNVQRAFVGSRISGDQVLFNEEKSICLGLRYHNWGLRLEHQTLSFLKTHSLV